MTPATISEPTTDIRPRDRGGILDLAFRLYRKQFLTALAILVVLYVPVQILVQLISIWLTGNTTALFRPLFGGASGRSIFGDGGVSSLLIYYLVTGLLPIIQDILLHPAKWALAGVVQDNYLGTPVSFGSVYRRVWKRIVPVLWLMGLVLLILVGIYVVPNAIVATYRATTLGSAATCAVALVGLAAPVLYIYVTVRFQLAVPAAMIENLGPVQALRRSWYMVEKNWWRTFGLLVFTLGLLGLAISYAPSVLAQWLASRVLHLDSFGNQVVAAVGGSLGSLLFLPIEYLVIAIYYFDLRIRQEGYDLEVAVDKAYPQSELSMSGQE